MNNKNKLHIFLGIIVVFVLLATIIVPLIPKEKPKAKLKGAKELNYVLNKKQINNIREGLYAFSKNNSLNKTYSYKKGSIDTLTDIRFKAIVKNKNNENEIVLIRYDKSKNKYLINFAYHSQDGQSAGSGIKEVYKEPDYVKIYNESILNKVTSDEKERIPDSMNDFVYNHDIEYTFYYITKLDITKDTITFSAKALNNRLFILNGTVDRKKQYYSYKQYQIKDKEAEEEESKWQSKVRG